MQISNQRFVNSQSSETWFVLLQHGISKSTIEDGICKLKDMVARWKKQQFILL